MRLNHMQCRSSKAYLDSVSPQLDDCGDLNILQNLSIAMCLYLSEERREQGPALGLESHLGFNEADAVSCHRLE